MPASPDLPAVSVAGLVVRYGRVTAVDGVSFDARAGQVLALLGPNGAGKTTTVETLEGYRRPDAGSVSVLGLDPVDDHAGLVPRLGVMLQRGGVYPGIRPREVLRLFAAFYPDPEDPDELLERVGLSSVARSTWRALSGGEQQRLSLALAVVGRPEVAFLDEPTAGVDPGGRQVVRQVVRDLAAAGAAVVLTTHELEEAERLADRVVIVDRGAVVAAGTLAELTAGGPAQEIRFGAPPGLDAPALAVALGAAVEEVAPGEYLVGCAPTPAAVAALTAWLADADLPLADLRAGRHTLEDVFLRLTGADHDEPDRARAGDGRAARSARQGRSGP
ncbi:MAG: ABC transporter ATP-binding protein [Actinomycetota bacterium]|nr:ABC transporter ATP-binding protein [Actinomycetota bacterium]